MVEPQWMAAELGTNANGVVLGQTQLYFNGFPLVTHLSTH